MYSKCNKIFSYRDKHWMSDSHHWNIFLIFVSRPNHAAGILPYEFGQDTVESVFTHTTPIILYIKYSK